MPRSSDFRRHAIVFTGIAAAFLSILGIVLFASDLSGEDLSDLPTTIWVALRDGFTLATSANNIIITVPTSAFASLRGAFGKGDDRKHVEASRGTTHLSGMYFSRVEDVSKVLGGIVFTQDHSLVLALANSFADNATCPITYDPLRITSAPTDVCPRFYVGVNLNTPQAGMHVNGGILSEDTITSKGTILADGSITAGGGFVGPASGLKCNNDGVCNTLSGLVANDTNLQHQIDIIVTEIGLNLTNDQCPNVTFCDIVTRVTNGSTGVITTNTITASTSVSTLTILADSIQSHTAATDLSITPSGTNVVIVTGKVLKTNTITATTGGGTVTSTSPLKTSDATASTSPSTGALQSSGGLGVSGSGFFGSNVDAAGNVATDNIVSHTAATDITITPTGTNVVIASGKVLKTNTLTATTALGTITSTSPFKTSDTTASSSPTTGALQSGGGLGVSGSGFFANNVDAAGNVATDTIVSHTAATDIAIVPTGTNVVIGTGKVLKINTLSVATAAAISVTDTVDFGNSIQCDEIDTHTPNGNMLLGTTGAGILTVNSVLMTSAGTTTIPSGQILKTNTIQTTTLNGDLTLSTTSSGRFIPNLVIFTSAGTVTIPAGQVLHTDSIAATTGSATVVSASPFKVSDTTDATTPTTGSFQTLGGIGVTKAGFFGGSINTAGSLAADTLVSHTAATDMTATPTGTNFVIATGKVLKTDTIQTTTTNGDLTLTTTVTGKIKPNNVAIDASGNTVLPTGTTLTVNSITSNALSGLTLSGANTNVLIGTGNQLLVDSITNQATLNVAITADGVINLSADTHALGVSIFADSGGFVDSSGGVKTDSLTSHTAATDMTATPTGTNFVIATGKVLKTNTLTATTGAGTITSTSPVAVSDATASTSSTTGCLKLSGGVSSALTTDATSSTNGGTFTSAGGGAFAKQLFVGTTLTVGTSVVLPTGTTPNLNTWDVTTLAVTMDGPCGTPGPAVTIGIRKLGGTGGAIVEIKIPTFTCTKTTTTAFVSSLALASAYQPPATVGAIMPVEEGTAINTAPGMATITAGGSIFVWQSMGSGSFTTAGTCGMPQYDLTITYMK